MGAEKPDLPGVVALNRYVGLANRDRQILKKKNIKKNRATSNSTAHACMTEVKWKGTKPLMFLTKGHPYHSHVHLLDEPET